VTGYFIDFRHVLRGVTIKCGGRVSSPRLILLLTAALNIHVDTAIHWDWKQRMRVGNSIKHVPPKVNNILAGRIGPGGVAPYKARVYC
jgi:hypothetical protein